MGLLTEFKEFAMKGNVVDLAVGLIIGAAFGGVVNSLVSDVLMPPLGYLTGKADFGELSIDIPVGKMEAVAGSAAAKTGLAEEPAQTPAEAPAQTPATTPAGEVAAAGAQVAQAGAAVAKEAAKETSKDAAAAESPAAGEARVVRIRYGKFLNACIAFLVQAFAVFLVVKGMNRLRRGKERGAQDTPQEPTLTLQEQLLQEIRDELKTARPPASA